MLDSQEENFKTVTGYSYQQFQEIVARQQDRHFAPKLFELCVYVRHNLTQNKFYELVSPNCWYDTDTNASRVCGYYDNRANLLEFKQYINDVKLAFVHKLAINKQQFDAAKQLLAEKNTIQSMDQIVINDRQGLNAMNNQFQNTTQPQRPILKIVPPQPSTNSQIVNMPVNLPYTSNNFMFWRNDLNLVYGSKRPYKKVNIEGNRLHLELQVLSPYVHDETHTNSSNNIRNHLVGYIGFVVSDRPLQYTSEYDYQQNKLNNTGIHSRKFINFPIVIDQKNYVSADHHTNFDRVAGLLDSFAKKFHEEKNWSYKKHSKEGIGEQNHSEHTLYLKLHDVNFVRSLVEQLKIELVGQDELSAGYRTYAVVLDLHSTNGLCNECKKLTVGLQNSNEPEGFITLLKDALQEKGFTKLENKIRVITRYTCDQIFNPTVNAKQVEREETHNLANTEQDIKKLVSSGAIINRRPVPNKLPLNRNITTFVSGQDGVSTSYNQQKEPIITTQQKINAQVNKKIDDLQNSVVNNIIGKFSEFRM